MTVRMVAAEARALNMPTRFPFRFGVTSMTELALLQLRCHFDIDGDRSVGTAYDALAPKWFMKDVTTSVDSDRALMLELVRESCREGIQVRGATTVYEFWQKLYDAMYGWADRRRHSPLLVGFGVSLVERAAIDAYCRYSVSTFAEAVRSGALGLGGTDESLMDSLPKTPMRAVAVRHTVGLSDALIDTDISDRIDDGLPETLEESINRYGLSYFKIKLTGDVLPDVKRVEAATEVIDSEARNDWSFTLDGNEQYDSIDSVRRFWTTLLAASPLDLASHFLFFEQPLERSTALGSQTAREMGTWRDRPPVIIDESDAYLGSCDQALECGYSGTSHKNCKGVFKSLLNASSLAQRRQRDPSGTYIMSSEDLTTVGPALIQDLSVVATLGIQHTERNGHHYVRGLSPFPDDVQKQLVGQHPDLFARSERGYVTPIISGGSMALTGVTRSPFGSWDDIPSKAFGDDVVFHVD